MEMTIDCCLKRHQLLLRLRWQRALTNEKVATAALPLKSSTHVTGHLQSFKRMHVWYKLSRQNCIRIIFLKSTQSSNLPCERQTAKMRKDRCIYLQLIPYIPGRLTIVIETQYRPHLFCCKFNQVSILHWYP